jgi:GTP-binding protein HflX
MLPISFLPHWTPVTRRVELPKGHRVLFTDTVGFIQKLPTQLIAAFRATLEEITEADLLIHVVDSSHPNALSQWKAVQQTLTEINADHIPVITAFNKIDLLTNADELRSLLNDIPDAIMISATKRTGLAELLAMVEKRLFEVLLPVRVHIPYQQGQLISLFHEQGQVEQVEHGRGGVTIQGQIPGRLLTRFQPFFIHNKKH